MTMPIPPPALALGAGLAQRALTRDAQRPTAARRVAAVGVALVSAGLATASVRLFRRRGTTLDPFEPGRASALVTTGPYAITRNPMYVGLTGLLVAHAVVRASWGALLPVAAFVAVIDRGQIAPEEAAMRTLFGADYEAYLAAVPRWLDRRSLPLGSHV